MKYAEISIIAFLAIIFMIIIIYLLRKKNAHNFELERLHQETLKLNREALAHVENAKLQEQQMLEAAEEKYQSLLRKYQEESVKNQEELDNFFTKQKTTRQQELDESIDQERQLKEKEIYDELADYKVKQEQIVQEEIRSLQIMRDVLKDNALKEQERLANDIEFQRTKFNGIIGTLQKYEMEKQERLFYTIQIPEEYKEDINFLVTTVSQKVQHPDIINKLVWTEYVKPYLDETIRRANIEDKSGIYKLTNINDGKCYVGKSTNVKKRIQDHFKASLHLGTISPQAIHDAIWRDGFWNWTVEIITYCDKEQLSELEKYYIDFFKAQEFGYNKNQGG